LKHLTDLHQQILTSSADRKILLLIDSLGYYNLQEHISAAPFLNSIFAQLQIYSSSTPSTTAVAIPELLLGVSGEQSNFLGYSLYYREQIIKMLNQPVARGLEFIKRVPTIFEKSREQGYKSYAVGPHRFRRTAINALITRGSEFVGRVSQPDIFGVLNDLLFAPPQGLSEGVSSGSSGPTLIYLYVGDLDSVAHHFGVGSPKYLATLSRIDQKLAAFVERLQRADFSAALYLTSDHGAINTDFSTQIDICRFADLVNQVRAIAGEPRFPYLYGDSEVLYSLAQRYLSRWFEVQTRAQFLDNPLVGDVVLSPKGSATLVDSTFQKESAMRLKAVHGGPSQSEMIIPVWEWSKR
jgi:hypothetical protein